MVDLKQCEKQGCGKIIEVRDAIEMKYDTFYSDSYNGDFDLCKECFEKTMSWLGIRPKQVRTGLWIT